VPCDGHQSFASVPALRFGFAEPGEDLVDALPETLEEQFFLAVDVAVDRRFRDIQARREIIADRLRSRAGGWRAARFS